MVVFFGHYQDKVLIQNDVPSGPMINVSFVVNNECNILRKADSISCRFFDDCSTRHSNQGKCINNYYM